MHVHTGAERELEPLRKAHPHGGAGPFLIRMEDDRRQRGIRQAVPQAGPCRIRAYRLPGSRPGKCDGRGDAGRARQDAVQLHIQHRHHHLQQELHEDRPQGEAESRLPGRLRPRRRWRHLQGIPLHEERAERGHRRGRDRLRGDAVRPHHHL